MCSGSKSKVISSTGVLMEGDCNTPNQEQGFCKNSSILLELSAVDDLEGFKSMIEEKSQSLDEPSSWYGRKIGSKKLGFEERTPLMIAAMFGSKNVLSYILQTGSVDVNRSCGSDGATALHCAAASGSCQSHEIVKLLLDASADISCVDANGARPCDVIPVFPNISSKLKKILEMMLKGEFDQESCAFHQLVDKQPVRKEYPVDPSLPDIKSGICSTDEFRMYTFKVKPCSRAYSHDWTECPFVHPGENARRRDPRKYHYTCVPCPEFRKASSCIKGDACEYAHGIFECWLHPAQYRTRLCKDETNCPRRVCFFAHKVEELRPLYASTGSAVMSPRSMSSIGGACSPFDMASLSPLAIRSSSVLMPSTSTPPMAPPFFLENQRRMQQLEELASLSSPSSWSNTSMMSNGCMEPAVLCQSPTGIRIRHNMDQQIRSSYPSASSVLSSRSAAFAQRSQGFIDRGAVNRLSPNAPMPSQLSDWGSPGGKVDWGIQGEELNKMRKSLSFGFRNSGSNSMGSSEQLSFEEKLKQNKMNFINNGGSEMIPSWVEQLYMEQEQMVA